MLIRNLILFTLAVVAIYYLFPDLDIAISNYFYREGQFYMKEFWLFKVPYYGMKYIIGATILVLLGMFSYQQLKKKDFKVLNRRAIAFLLSFFLLGPVITTNLILKKHWGRPKPGHTTLYGGKDTYVPYYRPTWKIQGNGSFVSGHVAAAFFFVAFAYLYKSWLLYLLSSGFVIFVAIMRVMQGGHFLSDVLFSYIINYFILIAVFWLFYRRIPSVER